MFCDFIKNKKSIKSMLIAGCLASVMPMAFSDDDLTSQVCTSNITSLTTASGCKIPAPAGATARADVWVKIFSAHSVGDSSIATDAIEGLNKVVLYAGGYGGTILSQLEISYLETLRHDGVSIAVIQPGPAGEDTVEQYSQQIQNFITRLNGYRNGLSSPEDMVFIGFSLGGVSGKHALASMESENVSHHFSTYISYDAPHNGVHVPQSIQRLKPVLDEYLDESEPFALGASVVFNSPISNVINLYSGTRSAISYIVDEYINAGIFKQLLVDNSYTDGSEFEDFFNSYNTLGYPQTTRNVAVSNGSIGINQLGYDNGNRLIDFSAQTSNNTYAKVDLKMYETRSNSAAMAMNLNLTGTVQSAPYKCFWFFTCRNTISVGGDLPKSRRSPSGTMALDSVPGGYSSNLSKIAKILTDFAYNSFSGPLKSPYYDSTTKQLIPLNESNIVNFSFVPTASSLGLPINSSPQAIQTAIDNNQTPFDKVIIKGDINYGGLENSNLEHNDTNLTPALISELRAALLLP